MWSARYDRYLWSVECDKYMWSVEYDKYMWSVSRWRIFDVPDVTDRCDMIHSVLRVVAFQETADNTHDIDVALSFELKKIYFSINTVYQYYY